MFLSPCKDADGCMWKVKAAYCCWLKLKMQSLVLKHLGSVLSGINLNLKLLWQVVTSLLEVLRVPHVLPQLAAPIPVLDAHFMHDSGKKWPLQLCLVWNKCVW